MRRSCSGPNSVGKAGAYYYWISRGIDHREVRANRIRKSIGAENTFSTDLTELEPMLRTAAADRQGLAALRRQGDAGRTVTLTVKYADFELISRRRTVAGAVNGRDELELISAELLKALFPMARAVRLLGVSISGFSHEPSEVPE